MGLLPASCFPHRLAGCPRAGGQVTPRWVQLQRHRVPIGIHPRRCRSCRFAERLRQEHGVPVFVGALRPRHAEKHPSPPPSGSAVPGTDGPVLVCGYIHGGLRGTPGKRSGVAATRWGRAGLAGWYSGGENEREQGADC